MTIDFQYHYGDTYEVPGEGLYIARFLDNTSVINLVNFVHKMRITKLTSLDANDLHCTIIYSKEKKPEAMLGPILEPVRAHLVGFEHWPGKNGDGYLVAKLKSDALQKIHSYWKAMGCEHSFPEYQPHVTLKHPCPLDEYNTIAVAEAVRELQRKPLTVRLLSDRLFEMTK